MDDLEKVARAIHEAISNIPWSKTTAQDLAFSRARSAIATLDLPARDAANVRKGLEMAAGVARNHRYDDTLVNACRTRREHREDIADAILALANEGTGA